MKHHKQHHKTFSMRDNGVGAIIVKVSVVLLVSLIVGFIISNNIKQYHANKADIFTQAIQIKDEELFSYAIRTNAGNALVEGVFTANNPVSFPEIKEKAMSISRVLEQYNQHTRTVTKTREVNGKTETYTETEIYYQWDTVKRTNKATDLISFHGQIFDYKIFSFASNKRLKMSEHNVADQWVGKVSGNHIYTKGSTFWHSVGDQRIYFTHKPITLQGCFLADIKDGSIFSIDEKQILVYDEKTTEEVVDMMVNNGRGAVIFFYIIWIFLTLIVSWVWIEVG